MKTKLLLIIIILFITFNAKGQINLSHGKIEYDMILNLGYPIKYNGTLLYNNKSSLFTYAPVEKEDIVTNDSDNNLYTIVIDTIVKKVFVDREIDSLFHFMSINNGIKKVVIETIPKLNWELSDETKKISDFNCNMATTTFRGRKYTAWYATELTNSYGPWKLQGLPGLILEAYDEKKEVWFSITKIKIPQQEQMNFNKSNCFLISYANYTKREKEKIEELKQFFKASQGRDENLSVEVKTQLWEKD